MSELTYERQDYPHPVELDPSRKYWVDARGNAWRATEYTWKGACEVAATLTDSYMCFNCSDCTNCISMSDCNYCEDSFNCKDCLFCRSLVDGYKIEYYGLEE